MTTKSMLLLIAAVPAALAPAQTGSIHEPVRYIGTFSSAPVTPIRIRLSRTQQGHDTTVNQRLDRTATANHSPEGLRTI